MAVITSAATGLWSATGTWTGGVVPAVGDKVTIQAAHTVTLDGVRVVGDDTSSGTSTSNALMVAGVLKFSRSVNAQLTVRGTLYVLGGGTLDMGSTADPIPFGITATLVLNDSASPSTGKHGASSASMVNPSWKMRGLARTVNTTLTAGIAAGASVLPVADATNWKAGDQLVVGPDTDDGSRSQLVTILSIAGLNVTITGTVTNARQANCRIGNLTSNVVVKSSSSATPGFICFGAGSGSTAQTLDIANVRFENIGQTSGWVGVNTGPSNYGFGFALNTKVAETVNKVIFYADNAAVTTFIGAQLASFDFHTINDFAAYTSAATRLVSFGDSAVMKLSNGVGYRLNSSVLNSAFSFGAAGCLVTGCELWGTQGISVSAGSFSVASTTLHASSGALGALSFGSVKFNNCVFSGYSTFVNTGIAYGTATMTLEDCQLSNTLMASAATGSVPNPSSYAQVTRANSLPNDHRRVNYYMTAVTDTATRNRGLYSVKMKPNVANLASTYSFTIPAVAGVQQRVKGYLGFDVTYGTATPPRIDLSGQGVTQTFTCPATSGSFFGFDFTFTPTTTGDVTATVTIQSTSTAGFAWLDGVYHYPMIQSTRHYGFAYNSPSAALTADSRITVSETTALAYAVVVDHTVPSIVVSAPLTNAQVFQALMANLAQAVNQGVAVHVTSTDGAAFVTTYPITFSGTGAISGTYTDSTGVHVAVTAPNIVSGSRVQLYDATGATELYNGVLAADGFSLQVTYAAGHTLRLRADHTSYLPLEVTGASSTAGTTFLNAQTADTVYVSNGVDGSTVTEFTPDGTHVEVDIDDPDGVTTPQRLYAWLSYYQTTAAGIASPFFGAVTAADSANYVIDQSKADIRLMNVSATPVIVAGGYLSRKDGTTVISPTSASIQMDAGRAYISASIATDVTQIRALAEADEVFVKSTNRLHFYQRGTTTDLIPAKTVTGTSQATDSALAS